MLKQKLILVIDKESTIMRILFLVYASDGDGRGRDTEGDGGWAAATWYVRK